MQLDTTKSLDHISGEQLRRFLHYLLEYKEDEILAGNLTFQSDELVHSLEIDPSNIESIISLFGEFYVFFKYFFNHDDVQSKREQISDAPEYIDQAEDLKTELILDENSAALFNDFCLLFKDRLIPLEKFQERFTAINKINKKYPMLFEIQNSVSLSNIGRILGEKLRQYKKLGKKPSKLNINKFTFKIK